MVNIGINAFSLSLFFLISRVNIACSPLIFNLQINYPIRIKDIPFKSSHLSSNKLSLKFQRFTLSGFKDIEIRTFEFVVKTRYLYDYNEVYLKTSLTKKHVMNSL